MHKVEASRSVSPHQNAPRRPYRFSVHAIFGDAVQDCDEILRLRQQSVAIDAADLEEGALIDEAPMRGLLARAIGDVASVSRRGGVLSLGAVDSAIVIQSNYPLDLLGEELAIDEELRAAAEHLQVGISMTWDQGRGPRLTLRLPAPALVVPPPETRIV